LAREATRGEHTGVPDAPYNSPRGYVLDAMCR
jgi:hypothetical protein